VLVRVAFAKYDPEYAKAYREKQRAKRDAQRAEGQVVVPPPPKVKSPPRVAKSIPVAQAVVNLDRGEPLPNACGVCSTVNEVTGADALNAVTYSKIEDAPARLRSSLKDYVGHLGESKRYGQNYANVNGALRQFQGNVTPGNVEAGGFNPKTTTWISNIDAALEKSTLAKPVMVARGVLFPEVNMDFMWSETKSMVGAEWKDDAFVSTATDVKNGTRMVDTSKKGEGQYGLRMYLHVPAGTHAIGFGNLNAGELLLDRGMTYRVTGDRGFDSSGVIRSIDVEVIPSP
jgi:hypothetical protein